MNLRLLLVAAAGVALQGCAHVSVSRERALVFHSEAIQPRVEGLTPEGVVVRRDRVVLRYSFR